MQSFFFIWAGFKQKCMTEYLSGKIVFRKPYQAYDKGDRERRGEVLAELENGICIMV